VARDERGQHVGDAGLVVGGLLAGAKQPVEVALALALQAAARERVGHGHQGEFAALQSQRAAIELGQDALDAQRAGDLVTVHPAQHEQPRPGGERGEGMDAQAVGGRAGKRIGRHAGIIAEGLGAGNPRAPGGPLPLRNR
jgi:hypothetical protein